MVKRLLLIMPNYYGFDEVVLDGLKAYSNCAVESINFDVGFKYENIFQRIDNACSKLFLGRNKKTLFKERFFSKQIDVWDSFDYLLVNRPDIVPVSILDKAIAKAKSTKLLLWDSLEKIPIS